MGEGWKHTRTIIGGVADGDNYFRRESIETKLWREIGKGNHILFSAPRRVGKSSIMKYIAEHPKSGYTCVYENISTDRSTEEFYKRLLGLLLKQTKHPALQKWREQLKGAVAIEKLSTNGIEICLGQKNYKQAILDILPKLKEHGEETIVLLLDEFPDVIKNISENEAEGPDAAVDVLQTLRSIRHNERFREHFVLVLAGSVGLAHVIKAIDRPAVINDLHEQSLPALSRLVPEGKTESEAERFIQHLVQDASMQIMPDCRRHLLDKLGQAIPFYIQLLIEKCNDLISEEERTQLRISDIDRAWDQLLEEHKHFSDADERLKDYFPSDYPYFVRILSHCAHEDALTVQEAYDMGREYGLGAEYKSKIDDVLIKDGYLQQEGLKLRFVSPLLQAWWKNRHPKITKRS